MTRRRLEALVEVTDNGLQVCAPAVGWFGGAPRIGEVMVGGSLVGRLEILGEWVDVVLPAGAVGRVEKRLLIHRKNPVDFKQTILQLVPVEADGLDVIELSAAAGASADLPEGAFAVTSPTHGMFYRRPKPDVPCYVEVGQVVEEGTTLGLVEVMKCFSAIAYGGDGLPSRAEVVEIRADDGVEVVADQILFVVKAAG